MSVNCFDTSSLIHAEVRAYPFENFASFWDKLDELVRDGRAILPIAALDELGKESDDLHA